MLFRSINEVDLGIEKVLKGRAGLEYRHRCFLSQHINLANYKHFLDSINEVLAYYNMSLNDFEIKI